MEREAKKVGPGFNKDLFLKSELMFFSDHSENYSIDYLFAASLEPFFSFDIYISNDLPRIPIPHICHFFTRLKFLENKIYTEKRQFFALNL